MSLFSGSSGIGVCYSLSFFPRVAFIFIPLLLLVWAFSNASISLSRSFSFRVSCQTGMCLFSRMNVCVLPHFDVSPEHACILDWDSTSLSSASTYLNSRLCVEDPSFYLLISAGLPRLYRLYLSFLYLQETRQRSRISTFTLNNREFFFFTYRISHLMNLFFHFRIKSRTCDEKSERLEHLVFLILLGTYNWHVWISSSIDNTVFEFSWTPEGTSRGSR